METLVLAPWTSTRNMGDEIIADAIVKALAEANIQYSGTLPTHRRPSITQLRQAGSTRHLLLGGSNIVSAKLGVQRQWLVTPDLVAAYWKKIVSIGVGWRAYQDDPGGYHKWLIRSIMDPDALHSVRDRYTASKFERLGLRAVNTGCPTLWFVPTEISKQVNSRCVVITITDYKPESLKQLGWVDELRRIFADVYLQPQNSSDVAFASTQLGIPNDHILPLSLPAYDKFLATRKPYYFGTRLHGGIRAMQHGLPAVIVPLDNRATEMGQDFGLCLLSDSENQRAAVEEALQNSIVWPGRELSRSRGKGLRYLAQLREYMNGARTGA